jgi:hypothetical protein
MDFDKETGAEIRPMLKTFSLIRADFNPRSIKIWEIVK